MELYKYCSFSANSISVLVTEKVWYCKPIDFNDPFDGEFKMGSTCTFEEYMKILGREISPDTYDSIKNTYCGDCDLLKPEYIQKLQGVEKALKNVGVLCLTKKRDSVLMWSHYADEHKGFSIKFDVHEHIPVKNVNYSKSIPENHPFYFYKKSEKDGYLEYQFTKHKDWEYENEYRISVNRGNRLVEFPGRIMQIDFGCRMKESHKESIYHAIRAIPYYKEIDLFSAVKSNNLELNFEPYKIEPNNITKTPIK